MRDPSTYRAAKRLAWKATHPGALARRTGHRALTNLPYTPPKRARMTREIKAIIEAGYSDILDRPTVLPPGEEGSPYGRGGAAGKGRGRHFGW
jgi:hypothetical protein